MNRLVAPVAFDPSVLQKKNGGDSVAGGWGGAGIETGGPLEHDRLRQPAVATFAPVHYEPGYNYPLLVWLHDAGQSEGDLSCLMPHVSTRNYVAVAPRGLSLEGDPWPQEPNALAEAEEVVFEAVEAARERFSVHSERIFLAGAGAGGTAALRVALANPAAFAGAATLNGPAPAGNSPLRCLKAARRLPLFLASGRESTRYPEERFCQDLRLLHSAGCQMKLWQHAGDGDLTVEVLSELDRWMMGLVCAPC